MLDDALLTERRTDVFDGALRHPTSVVPPIAYKDLIAARGATRGTMMDASDLRLIPVTDLFVLTQKVLTEPFQTDNALKQH